MLLATADHEMSNEKNFPSNLKKLFWYSGGVYEKLLSKDTWR